MGAIVAIIGEPGDPEIPERLERMLARSPYRGTPERHLEGGLAIAVQSRGWDASLATVGNWTVAMHGVIGNWDELAPAHGWDFPDDATSATKLAIAYENLGDDLFGKLRGEYAILIHDRRAHELTAVRDPWGWRPLFFQQRARDTFFASEIRQVLAGTGASVEIDTDVLAHCTLQLPTFSGKTHVQNIERISAGRAVSLRRDQKYVPNDSTEYWSPPESSRTTYDADELADELRFLLDRAVQRWIIGVPFAFALSGGVDSGTLWSIIAEEQRGVTNRPGLGRAFSWLQPGHRFDESDQIARILEATNSEGVVVDVSELDRAGHLIENAHRLDSPSPVALSYMQPLVSRIHDADLGLMLTGDGGDIMLGGSPGYLRDLVRSSEYLTAVFDLFSHRPDKGHSRWDYIRKRALDPMWRRLTTRQQRKTTRAIPPWIHDCRAWSLQESLARTQRATADRSERRHRALILDQLATIPRDAVYEGMGDLLSSYGIEHGFPFFDLDLTSFALRLPPRAFSGGRRYKHLLRKVKYDHLGRAVREWENPEPWFCLERWEVDSLEKLLPPKSWTLVEISIVDAEQLASLFRRSLSDRRASHDLGHLAVTEAVVSRMTCRTG